jgi:hypothetical protein
MLVSGMIIGTVFTLFVLPSVYMLLARHRVALVADTPVRDLIKTSQPEGAAA